MRVCILRFDYPFYFPRHSHGMIAFLAVGFPYLFFGVM